MEIQDTESLAAFQHDPAPVIDHLKRTGMPIALTIEGRSEVVLQDAKAYERFLEVVDRAEAVVAVRKGLASMERGEGIALDDAFQQIRRRHNLPATS